MLESEQFSGAKAVDWAFPIVGLVLAVFLAWGIGWIQAREEYKREYTPKAYAEAAKKDAETACIGNDPRAVFDCVNEKTKAAYQTAHDEQDLSAQQRAASSSLASAVLNFLALTLSGVGVWYVKRTLDATLEAVKDTSRATQAMEEANRIAKSARIDQMGESNRVRFREMLERKRVSEAEQRQLRAYIGVTSWQQITVSDKQIFEIDIKNFGQTPASDLRISRALVIGTDLNYDVLNFEDRPGVHLAPGNEWKRIAAHITGTQAPIVYVAEIRYRDVFGDEWGLRLGYVRNNRGEWHTGPDGSSERQITKSVT